MTFTPCPKPAPKIREPKPLQAKGRSRFPAMRADEYRAQVKATYPCALYGLLIWRHISNNDREIPTPESSTVRYEHRCWGAPQFAHVFQTQGMGAGDVGEGVVLCEGAHQCFDQRWTRTEFARYTGVTKQMLQVLAGKIARELGWKRHGKVWTCA